MSTCLAMLEDSEDPRLGMTKDKFNFFNINKALTNSENEFAALKDYFNGRSKLSQAYTLSRQVLSAADTTLSSYMSITFDKLNMFNDRGLCGLTSATDVDAAGFAEQVKARLLGKKCDLKISIGNPTCSVEELEMAAEADMGVAFVEMKKSKRAMLREWKQICARYKLPLAGSVSVQRCWN